MTFEEIRSAVTSLSPTDQKRLIMEIVPAIWPQACIDDACLEKLRSLVDEAAVKEYREQHMGSI